MSQTTLLIIIAILAGGGISAVILYYILRFLRGSIKLTLPRTAFNPGDTISGSFELLTKKAIQGKNLTVRLIGVEKTKTYKDGKSQTRSREIYRDEVLIEDAKSYPPGFSSTYNFEIPTPNMQSPEFLNSTVGQALGGAIKLLSNRSTQLKWKIEARLSAKGVDLAKSKPVTINIRQLV